MLLLFLVAIVACQSPAIQFIEGFVVGVETDIGNVTECVDESVITFEDLEKAVEDFEYGFKHLSVKHIEAGFDDLADALHEISLAIKDCNATHLIEDIQRLVEEIKEGKVGLIKIIVHEIIEIFSHGKDITHDIKEIISSAEAKEWKSLGYFVGKVTGYLLNGV